MIKGWLQSSGVSLFDQPQLESLASSMKITKSRLQQMIDDVLLSRTTTGAELYGQIPSSLNNLSIVSSPVPPGSHVSADLTLRDTTVLQFLRKRGPKCQLPADPAALRRRDDKIYQCTHCGYGFARKDEWIRHEHAGVYPQEVWLCDLDSEVRLDGNLVCSTCGVHDPASDHSHKNHPSCAEKPTLRRRIFFRKNQFTKHFENCHQPIPPREYLISSRIQVNTAFPRGCGFCDGQRFQSWKDRMNHIGDHYKRDEMDMSSWKQPPDCAADSDDDFDSGSDNDEDDDDDDDENGNNGNGYNDVDMGTRQNGDSAVGQQQQHGYGGFRGSSNGQSGNSYSGSSGTYGVMHRNLNVSGISDSEAQHSDKIKPIPKGSGLTLPFQPGCDNDNATVRISNLSSYQTLALQVGLLSSTCFSASEQVKTFTVAMAHDHAASSTGSLHDHHSGSGGENSQSPRTSLRFLSTAKRLTESLSKRFRDLRSDRSLGPDQQVKSNRRKILS